jgi:hypothetical protein
MRFGIISIGISEDAYAPNRWGTGEVLYADRDAEAVRQALEKSCADHENAGSHLLVNRQATFEGIELAFRSFTAGEPLALLVVFLAGHGHKCSTASGETTFFCTADGSPARPGLDAGDLANFLRPIRARKTLLMADCCFAQGFVAPCEHFGELPDNVTARFWLAAAGRMEQSWEDTETKHGVFAREVLAGLARRGSTESESTTIQWIDVAGEFFPHLVKQVPIRAAQTAPLREQHPVFGGISSGSLLLPVPTGKGPSQEITPLIAFRRLAKAGLLLAIVVALCLGVFVQTTRYHLVQGANGNIVVRRGTATTDFLTPGKFGVLVDTAFGPTSLAAQDSALAPLRSGSVRGWWLPLSANGYRTWIEKLQPFLTPEGACRAELYLKGRLSAELPQLLSSDADPWLVELASEAALLGQSSNLPPWTVLAAFPSMLKSGSGTKNAQILDFTILYLNYAAIENYSHAIANLAAVNDDIAAKALFQLLEIVAHRADNPGRDIDVRREARLLAGAMSAIIEVRAYQQKAILKDDERKRLEDAGTPVGKHLRLVCLAAAGKRLDLASQKAVQSELIHQLGGFDLDKQGSALTDWQAAAADALANQIKAGGPIEQEVFDCIRRLGKSFGGTLLLPHEVIESLVQASRRNELPPDLRQEFMRSLALPVQSNGPAIFPLMRILASGAGRLDERDQVFVLQQVKRITKELSTNHRILPECAEALGILGEQGITDEYALKSISRQIRPKPYIDRRDTGEDPRVTIRADDGAAFAIALGRIAQGLTLKHSSAALLWRAALNRGDLADYPAIVAGLAAQERQPLNTATDVRAFISRHAKSFPERQLATDLLCFCVRTASSSGTSNNLVESLRSECKIEEEPELRIALYRVLLAFAANDHISGR